METFGDRMRRAWQILENQERVRRLSFAAAAKLLNERQGIEVDGSTIAKWVTYGTVPSVERVLAFAKLAGVDPGWLAFGADCKVLGPGDMSPYYPPQARQD